MLAKRFRLLFLAYTVFLIALAMDLVILVETPLLAEGNPEFEGIYFFRTILIGLCSFLFVTALTRSKPWIKDHGSQRTSASEVSIWGQFVWKIKNLANREALKIDVSEVLIWSLILLSVLFISLYLYSPTEFYRLGSEDHAVEMISAALSIVASIVFIRITFNLMKLPERAKRSFIAGSLAFAFLFFLVGMEEISWFQRVFSIKTPEVLAMSPRDEMNLHNLATDEIENIYYFSAFLFLVVIPFVHEKTKFLEKNDLVSFFSPTRTVLLTGAIAMAYNYDMWNIIFTQLSFFITLSILLHYARRELVTGISYALTLTLSIVLAGTQILFLLFGNGFIRIWDVTEYKELFIPIAFLVYSLEMLAKAKHFAPYQAPMGTDIGAVTRVAKSD